MPQRARPSMVDFGGIDIVFDPRVLEPRAWTVRQAAWAAKLAEDAPSGPLLELCSGAGHIGLLAARLTRRRLVAVDADPVACGFGRANAQRNGLAPRVEVRCCGIDVACDQDEVFPVIVADPPWVPTPRVTEFPEDPVLAIDGGPDGLALVQACLQVIAAHLHPEGAAVLQVGPDQHAAVTALLPPTLQVIDVEVEPGRGALLQISRAREAR